MSITEAESLSDAAEVGRILSLSPASVLRLGRLGLIPRVVITRKTIRFRLSEVQAALEQRGQEQR